MEEDITMDKKAKAYIFINGRLEMHRILDIEKWLTKDLKIVKNDYTINFPTTVTQSGFVELHFSPAYVSLFSARNGRGLYLVISLYNPIFARVDKYPLKTLAEAKNPINLELIPYA